jgi:hypothetical protein
VGIIEGWEVFQFSTTFKIIEQLNNSWWGILSHKVVFGGNGTGILI